MKLESEIPFINVRDLVMFPKMTQGLYIGRLPTINAIQYALTSGNKKVLVLPQKQSQMKMPRHLRDMYSVGTICSAEGSILLRDGTMKAVLTGEELFKVERILEQNNVQFAYGKILKKSFKINALDKAEKLKLLELLVRAKPLAALDEDALWFKELKSEGNGTRFIETFQKYLNYKTSFKTSVFKQKTSSKREVDLVNSKVRLQQQLLQEVNKNKKLELLEGYLKFEIKNAAANL